MVRWGLFEWLKVEGKIRSFTVFSNSQFKSIFWNLIEKQRYYLTTKEDVICKPSDFAVSLQVQVCTTRSP